MDLKWQLDPDHFERTWEALRRCESRGIYCLDDNTRVMHYAGFAQIYRQAGLYAAFLQENGIIQGDQVLISAKTSLDLIYLWPALIWIGATPVPMPPRDVFLSPESYRNRLKPILPNFKHFLCQEYEASELGEIAQEYNPELTIINFSGFKPGEVSKQSSIPARVTPKSGDIAFIQFTSGSTNHPKGIMISYRNLLTNIHDIWTRLQVNPGTLPIASWLPIYHDMGLVGFFLGCLFAQAELTLISPLQFAKNPLRFLSLLSEKRVEMCGMTNFALEWILRCYQPEKQYSFDLTPLKWVGIGAEPINMAKMKKFEETFAPYGLRKGVLSPCYGLAEATLAVSMESPLTQYQKYSFNGFLYPTVGPLLPGLVAKIEKTSESDTFGLIKIKGANVAAQAIIDGKIKPLPDAEGFYNTKDIGCFQGERLVVLGRADDVLIINGENRFPHEIEALVRDLNKVSRNRVVCFGVSAAESTSGDAEVVILYETQTLSGADQIATAAEMETVILKNTGIKVNKIIGAPPKTIPVTPSGKVQRYLVRQRYLDGAF